MPRDRLARARTALAAQDLDVLLVTHPANVRYLTGLNASAGAVLVTRDRCTLLVDFRYATAAQQQAVDQPDLLVKVTAGAFDDEAARLIEESHAARVGVEADHLSLGRFNTLSARLAPGRQSSADSSRPELVATERLIERLRAVKDGEEILILREAAERLSRVASGILRWPLDGRTEADVARAIDDAMRVAGFERAAFETIVASGPNSALPHARPTLRRIERGDGVVLDFGGVYDGYCVDLTRTVSVGPATDAFRRLFTAVREAQAAAVAAVRPGALPRDIDAAARSALDRHGLAEAFGHGTGHGLGLEVHEEPRISKLAPVDEPVVSGMVFTIEPGAYVPGVGGVRIEDDVLVVDGGCDVLTRVPLS